MEFSPFNKGQKSGLPWFHQDRSLVQLTPSDHLTIGDSHEGTIIFGGTGSGKTSGSGQYLSLALLREGFGGLVLTAKPDEVDLWKRWMKWVGREDEPIIFSIENQSRFNFLQFERDRLNDPVSEVDRLVKLLVNVVEVSDPNAFKGNDSFWRRELEKFVGAAIEVILAAGLPLDIATIHDVINSVPLFPSQITDVAWRETSVCFTVCEQAAGQADLSIEFDVRQSIEVLTTQAAQMDERTRGNVQSTCSGILRPLSRGPFKTMFSGDSTFTPSDTHYGWVVILDLPVKRFGDVGRLAQVIIKMLWQRATESRGDAGRPVFLWADEAQYFLTPEDASYQQTARSSRASTVYLTQNLPSIINSLGGGPEAENAAHSILGNLNTKIFHANSDTKTNEWAENLFSKSWAWHTSTSSQGNQDYPNKPWQSGTVSRSQSLDPQVLAASFLDLMNGGSRNKKVVEAIVFSSGRRWNNSKVPAVKACFRQLGKK